MSDLSKVDVIIECAELNNVSVWSRKLYVDLWGADMTDFIDDYRDEILEHIGKDEVSSWLESQGCKVESE